MRAGRRSRSRAAACTLLRGESEHDSVYLRGLCGSTGRPRRGAAPRLYSSCLFLHVILAILTRCSAVVACDVFACAAVVKNCSSSSKPCGASSGSADTATTLKRRHKIRPKLSKGRQARRSVPLEMRAAVGLACLVQGVAWAFAPPMRFALRRAPVAMAIRTLEHVSEPRHTALPARFRMTRSPPRR